MITRSNLADQLREYQVRSQHNWASLSFFSSTGQIASRSDSTRACLWLFLFFVLLISSFIALYLRYTWPAVGFVCFAILLPICLKIIRHFKLARKRQRRMLYLYPCKPEDVCSNRVWQALKDARLLSLSWGKSVHVKELVSLRKEIWKRDYYSFACKSDKPIFLYIFFVLNGPCLGLVLDNLIDFFNMC